MKSGSFKHWSRQIIGEWFASFQSFFIRRKRDINLNKDRKTWISSLNELSLSIFGNNSFVEFIDYINFWLIATQMSVWNSLSSRSVSCDRSPARRTAIYRRSFHSPLPERPVLTYGQRWPNQCQSWRLIDIIWFASLTATPLDSVTSDEHHFAHEVVSACHRCVANHWSTTLQLRLT